MKKTISVILLTLTFLFSCTDIEKEAYYESIKIQNQKLKDSIEKLNFLLHINQKMSLELAKPYKDKKGNYHFIGKFYMYTPTEPYDVFIVRNDKRIKVLEDQTISQFDLKIKPFFLKDSILRVEAEFPQKDGLPLNLVDEYEFMR